MNKLDQKINQLHCSIYQGVTLSFLLYFDLNVGLTKAIGGAPPMSEYISLLRIPTKQTKVRLLAYRLG